MMNGTFQATMEEGPVVSEEIVERVRVWLVNHTFCLSHVV